MLDPDGRNKKDERADIVWEYSQRYAYHRAIKTH